MIRELSVRHHETRQRHARTGNEGAKAAKGASVHAAVLKVTSPKRDEPASGGAGQNIAGHSAAWPSRSRDHGHYPHSAARPESRHGEGEGTPVRTPKALLVGLNKLVGAEGTSGHFLWRCALPRGYPRCRGKATPATPNATLPQAMTPSLAPGPGRDGSTTCFTASA